MEQDLEIGDKVTWSNPTSSPQNLEQVRNGNGPFTVCEENIGDEYHFVRVETDTGRDLDKWYPTSYFKVV